VVEAEVDGRRPVGLEAVGDDAVGEGLTQAWAQAGGRQIGVVGEVAAGLDGAF
jgi:hypothetical protein